VADYLTFRQQRVAINGITSDYIAVLSGVPQGSVLGALLFLIYVDNLASLSISVGSQISMKADNLLLFRAISTQSDYCVLRNDVAAIENCSSSNSLNFNISKCKYMVISRKRTPTTPASPILLNSILLERVELFKHFGVVVSSDLSWSNHITSICAKAISHLSDHTWNMVVLSGIPTH